MNEKKKENMRRRKEKRMRSKLRKIMAEEMKGIICMNCEQAGGLKPDSPATMNTVRLC
jgi:hypothetical protein